jgi:peroxin-2
MSLNNSSPAQRRYRTMADRILRLRLVPARPIVTRNVSYEFMNREMVWHSLTVCKTNLPFKNIAHAEITFLDTVSLLSLGILNIPAPFGEHSNDPEEDGQGVL